MKVFISTLILLFTSFVVVAQGDSSSAKKSTCNNDPATDEKLWNETRETNSVKAYNFYIKNCRNGSFRSEARMKRNELENADVEAYRSITPKIRSANDDCEKVVIYNDYLKGENNIKYRDDVQKLKKEVLPNCDKFQIYLVRANPEKGLIIFKIENGNPEKGDDPYSVSFFKDGKPYADANYNWRSVDEGNASQISVDILEKGSYYITVSDKNGNQITSVPVHLAQPKFNVESFGNGKILRIKGGLAPFTFSINDTIGSFPNGRKLTGLNKFFEDYVSTSGDYDVKVLDANNIELPISESFYVEKLNFEIEMEYILGGYFMFLVLFGIVFWKKF